ncbi:MAG: hypothetical protein ABIG39_01760 [Candidatus Micrarchaeota archaeon]
MKLLEWIFKRNQLSKEERLLLENMGRKIQAKLGRPFSYHPMRRICYSDDNLVAITTADRHLFHISHMRKVVKKDLLFQKTTIGDAKNMFPKRHFSAIADALNWDCETYMGKNGNAPALFKAGSVNIWLSPILIKA